MAVDICQIVATADPHANENDADDAADLHSADIDETPSRAGTPYLVARSTQSPDAGSQLVMPANGEDINRGP
jgi:hypothetical protein